MARTPERSCTARSGAQSTSVGASKIAAPICNIKDPGHATWVQSGCATGRRPQCLWLTRAGLKLQSVAQIFVTSTTRDAGIFTHLILIILILILRLVVNVVVP